MNVILCQINAKKQTPKATILTDKSRQCENDSKVPKYRQTIMFVDKLRQCKNNNDVPKYRQQILA